MCYIIKEESVWVLLWKKSLITKQEGISRAVDVDHMLMARSFGENPSLTVDTVKIEPLTIYIHCIGTEESINNRQTKRFRSISDYRLPLTI